MKNTITGQLGSSVLRLMHTGCRIHDLVYTRGIQAYANTKAVA